MSSASHQLSPNERRQMSRTSGRITAVVFTLLFALTATLVALPAATAATPITGLSAQPQPPQKVNLSWNAYTDFPVDHYVAVIQPGNRTYTVDAPDVSVTAVDLSWGTNYTAAVHAVGTGGETSDTTTLVLAGTKLSASISKSYAVRGSKVSITGRLRAADDSPKAGADLKVQVAFAPVNPAAYQTVKTPTTDNKGQFSVRVEASRTAVYRVLYTEEDTAGGWDGNLNLAVAIPISLKFSDNPVPSGKPVRFSGKLDCPAGLVSGIPIALQRRVGGTFKTVKSGTVKANGRYSIRYTPASSKDQFWRVSTQGGSAFTKSVSKAKLLTVR